MSDFLMDAIVCLRRFHPPKKERGPGGELRLAAPPGRVSRSLDRVA